MEDFLKGIEPGDLGFILKADSDLLPGILHYTLFMFS